ncbi:ChaN family lipoprotein [Flavobacterium sp. I3-2]|uniref:ChaN family lipoprotein n=1 Tax=Flavobacterium sp. I3-2 TaxID=2748319 RepID=UPI00293B91CF|nr:ChaN family lipoprotein [Flavobacterium sp. I3-2]
MMKKLFTFMLLLATTSIFAQELKPYQIYNSKGKKITFEKMVKELQKSDLILFGEFHDNSIVHWLQLKTIKALAENKPLILGMEMFERDNQVYLNDYLNGKLSDEDFGKSARLWNNYKTDYKPLVDFAKENKMEVIATNVPRKFASLLYKEGEEALLALNDEDKQWIAPLPFPYDASLPAYVKMMDMFKDSDHANPNFPKAQAIKDATMAYSIVQNFKPNNLFVHFNGAYHSNDYEGIFWYVNKYNSDIKMTTISVLQKANINEISLTEKQLADYIIIVDEDMTKTF